MMRCAILFLSALGLLNSAVGETLSVPPPFTAHYEGQKRVLVIFNATGKATLTLQRAGHYIKYTSHSEAKAAGIERTFYDCSIIRVKGDKLYPLEYRHVDKTDAENNVVATFDWSNERATVQRGDRPEPQTVDISWPTWDPMSFQVAIMSIAASQPAGSSQTHTLLEKNRLRDYSVSFNGKVDTETELADIDVHEVASQRINKDGNNGLWLAPGFSWVPAKIAVDDVFLHLQAAPEPLEAQAVEDDAPPSC